MAARRILLVEHPTELSIQNSRLRLRREGVDDSFVLPDDIAVLVLHHHTIRLSVHVLRALSQAGSMILVTDERHCPAGVLWPWNGGSVLVRRLRQQITLDGTEKQAALWSQLVQSRIATQAMNLRYLGRKGALRLERLCRKVVPGDKGNIEAQASRHYWQYLLPSGVRREKHGSNEPLNIRLNFGFAVLRSLVAREIAAVGLNPALGLGHHSSENPLNLADDLMEPYRFIVERQVMNENVNLPFDGTARVALLQFLSNEVELARSTFRIQSAIGETVASLTRILNGKQHHLNAPGLPCQPMLGG